MKVFAGNLSFDKSSCNLRAVNSVHTWTQQGVTAIDCNDCSLPYKLPRETGPNYQGDSVWTLMWDALQIGLKIYCELFWVNIIFKDYI